MQTLSACSGNISNSAKKLGISRSTLYKKMAAWTR
jgi:transcriptional regulator of acetoin/glycerol metabolism